VPIGHGDPDKRGETEEKNQGQQVPATSLHRWQPSSMAGSKVTGGPRFGTGCWQPRPADRLLMVLRFTREGGMIVEIEAIGDPDRVR
jgi:hypothetical protein